MGHSNRVGFSDLREHRFNHNLNCENPTCFCGIEDETHVHNFLCCPRYNVLRVTYLGKISHYNVLRVTYLGKISHYNVLRVTYLGKISHYNVLRVTCLGKISDIIGNDVMLPREHLYYILIYGRNTFNDISNKFIISSTIQFIRQSGRFKDLEAHFAS